MMNAKKGLWVPENYRHKWLCLWSDENGRIIVNEDREYLCAESWTKGDETVEARMREAAVYYGITLGKPVWVPGRKVTANEWDDQMERYIDGKIPDWEQEAGIRESGDD